MSTAPLARHRRRQHNTETAPSPPTACLPLMVQWLPAIFPQTDSLAPWLGPALRGLVLHPLRQQLCLLDGSQQAAREARANATGEGNYCLDCALNPNCSYGQIWEPDQLLIAGEVRHGNRQGLRKLTIGSDLFLPSATTPDNVRWLRMLAIGDVAIGMLPRVTEVLQQRGPTAGIGTGHARFDVVLAAQRTARMELDPQKLPTQVCGEVIPELPLELLSPLFLKRKADPRQRQQSRHYQPHVPTLGELFREALRTVRRAVQENTTYRWADDVDWPGLVAAANRVSYEAENFYEYQQNRSSARQESRWKLRGILGTGVYRNVPITLVPWLQVAGDLGVGDSRNCGAGLWRLGKDASST